jgi:hypothetical protein
MRTRKTKRNCFHVRFHVKNLPNPGGHSDDTLITEIDGMALLSPRHASKINSSELAIRVKGKPIGTKGDICFECGFVA